MNSKKFKFVFKCLFALTAMTFVIGVKANASEPREAWISKSIFDGKKFSYEYIAYDAKEPIQDAVKINCEYGNSAHGLLLKAVEVKIMLDADFSNPGAQVRRTGSVDVRKAVIDCQKILPNARNAVRSPVAIKLPPISVSN